MTQIVLVCGPCHHRPGDTGGAGAWSAAAAIPFAPVQLWARVHPPDLLQRPNLDLTGCQAEGPSGSDLPTIEPTSATDLGAICLVDLKTADLERVLRIVQKVPALAKVPRVVVPPPGADRSLLLQAAQGTQVLIVALSDALTALGVTCATTAAHQLQAGGALNVALTAGPLGGLLAYKGLAASWPALSRPDSGPRTGFRRWIMAGTVSAWCGGAGKWDLSQIRRALAIGGAVAGTLPGQPPLTSLLSLDRSACMERFDRLRRGMRI